VRPESKRIFGNVLSAPDGDDLEAHLAGILQRHVSEPANAEDGDRIARFGAAFFQGVERRDPGAQDRGRRFGIEFLRNSHKSGGPGQHHFRITAVAEGPHDGLVPAELKLSLPTSDARVAMTAEPAYADTLSRLPDRWDAFASGDDPADHFMARYARRDQRRVCIVYIANVRTADPARLDRDQDLARSRHRGLTLHQLQGARRRHLHRSVGLFHLSVSAVIRTR
jgi:hypothetical protein